MESILRNQKSVLPVSSLLQGQYGLREVCLSLPSIVDRGGVEKILELPLSEIEIERLERSARILKRPLLLWGCRPNREGRVTRGPFQSRSGRGFAFSIYQGRCLGEGKKRVIGLPSPLSYLSGIASASVEKWAGLVRFYH
ncbi:MAG TPA: hypothetical protein DCP08_01785 [Chloroflexi bacterium]|nr:hypothetical protein [Chloroflexota bacterium]